MTDATNHDEVFRKHVDDLMRFATGLVGPFDAADVVNDAGAVSCGDTLGS